jgi:hypothetical protein
MLAAAILVVVVAAHATAIIIDGLYFMREHKKMDIKGSVIVGLVRGVLNIGKKSET